MFKLLLVSGIFLLSNLNFGYANENSWKITQEALNEKYACPPYKNREECFKKVATRFKECSDSVNISKSSINNDEALNQCKENAKLQKENCKKTCFSKEKSVVVQKEERRIP